ncbi:MAG: LysM domain-containing protein [Acidobacteriota bacterium]|nr:LysM domain-containing protein [Acidobacteriota bacterium]
MKDPLQKLLEGPPLEATAFPQNSRYSGLGTLQIESPDGTKIVYLKRRFVPRPEQFVVVGVHLVSEGERLDNITARYLGDPELFWRLADANRVLDPDELTDAIGAEILITLPAGIPGSTR